MDLLKDLMNPNKTLQKQTYEAAPEHIMEYADFNEDANDYNEYIQLNGESQSNSYADEYQIREQQMYVEMANFNEERMESNSHFVVDGASDLLSSVGRVEVDNLRREELRSIYGKYNFKKSRTQPLVIDSSKEQIVRLINTNQVVVIQGPTGCGKTTQVPQFILDDCNEKDLPCKIVVTQPRRLAAISVARRVSEERGWGLGTLCGYQVGLEREVSSDTLITYVTTGVLLQKLIRQKNLHEFTHIIVDEVHERIQDMDFLLLVIRRFLNTNSLNTKVILMSATFESEDFAKYFKSFYNNQPIPAPIIFIEKSYSFNTQIFYVEQLKALTREIPPFNYSEPRIDSTIYDLFVFLMRTFDRLDPVDPQTNRKIIGNVLVFLPGILEIEEAHTRLTAGERRWKSRNNLEQLILWQILPLHSSITIEEQRQVFRSPNPGYRKIILSTNIAESSITVPDVVYVVDFCLTKSMTFDPETQYQSLKLLWASHVNCTQRSGRVGRVSDGRVYRLVTRHFYETQMDTAEVPEILRAPLNRLVLASKLLDLNEPPKAILALTMDPPNLGNIDNTILYLKEIGGLSMNSRGIKMATDGELTFMGRVMANLPLDVHLAKFIVLGHIFNCLDDCIIMATGCTLNIFKSPFKERLKAYTNRLTWADSSASDLIAYLNLYKVWRKQKRLFNDSNLERTWCQKHFISQRSLNEWYLLVREIKDRLFRLNIQTGQEIGNVVNATDAPIIIKAVICGAFYPNYFNRSSDGGQVDEREAVKTLGGRDPYNTVYYTGFDFRQPGPLYAKSIKKLLADCASDMKVSFENSNKVYVEFLSYNQLQIVKVDGQDFVTGMPGKIRTEVYRSVRLRQLRISQQIPIMNVDRAWDLVKQKGMDKSMLFGTLLDVAKMEQDDNEIDSNNSVLNISVIPSLDLQYMKISVSHRISAGHFYVHNISNNTKYILSALLKAVNPYEGLLKPPKDDIKVGGIYVAMYNDDQMYYRCKILCIYRPEKSQIFVTQALFIDYGNTETINLEDIYSLPYHPIINIPAQAIECYLSEVQPSLTMDSKGLWSDKANKLFDEKTQVQILFAKVYSVVNGVVHIELHNIRNPEYMQTNYLFSESVNAWLIRMGVALPAEESFLSKENHLKRLQLIENPDIISVFTKEEKNISTDIREIEPPSSNACSTTLNLKGPFSPLEMSIYSVIASGMQKKITIEPNSVNTVLLDSDPQDPHERLIVAASISQGASGNTLALRHTTLMANIHGLPMIMSLLFCPTMEPKLTADGSKIAAVLCGLGIDELTSRSMFPPHDICLTLDTELTEDDMNQINELRYWMNVSINSLETNFCQVPGAINFAECQRETRTRLFKLLQTKRTSVKRTYVKNSHVWGKSLYDGIILQPGGSGSPNGTDIWPLHWTYQIEPQNVRDPAIERNMQELEEYALRMTIGNQINCELCKQTFYSAPEMRLHLSSQQHKDEKNIYLMRVQNC